MPDDNISFLWAQAIPRLDASEDMAKYCIFFCESLRPELQKTHGVKTFLAWLDKMYLNADTNSFQKDELKIIKFVARVCKDLDISDEKKEELDITKM